jgi:hypothetical protein
MTGDDTFQVDAKDCGFEYRPSRFRADGLEVKDFYPKHENTIVRANDVLISGLVAAWIETMH